MKTLCVTAILAAAMAAHGAEWISVPDAPVYRGAVKDGSRAADGTSWFARSFTNSGEVASAKWTVSGLGVFEVFVNGKRVGDDFLKPGFTHCRKTKYSFSYDVTGLLKRGVGEKNVLAAEVSAGWWRDKIVTPAHDDASRGFTGDRSAFLGDLEVVYADGSVAHVATDPENWTCGVAGSVTHAAIFDGEEFDARIKDPVLGEGLTQKPDVNTEFRGELLPTHGAEVALRRDLAIARGPYSLKKGETVLVDFGQNAAFVPEFLFSAKRGTVLTALCGEMLNDADEGSRGCDGPKGTLYRANLRVPDEGMRLVYTFAGDSAEKYMPRFTFFGYRYLALTATDDVEIESVTSVPVTSIRRDMELGRIETGVKDLNRLIANVYWGQLSNYLSVPTDCPQRNERLGWTADTQVFAETGAFNADTSLFFRKWMRDMRDTQHEDGSFSGVAPKAQYGDAGHRLGWADAGIIVPWTVWRMFGDAEIVNENWGAMTKYMDLLERDRYESQASLARQWADWLSYEKLETKSGAAYETAPDGSCRVRADALEYWKYLGLSYWLWDARMMSEMAAATGRRGEARKYAETSERALGILREKFVSKEDGMLIPIFRDMQTPALFALKLGLLEGEAKERTVAALKKNISDHGDCLQTGFLGTSIIMDTLTECGAADVAYTLLLQHKNPSWLYSVDQGATTVWERWNSYTKADGFGPVEMNSFNHYAYGAVLAWMYKTVAGIAPDSSAPGFRRIVMAPKPDRRLGFVKAEYKSAAGLIKSSWRYEGDEWIWEFTIPNGATASVTLPGESEPKDYLSGTYRLTSRSNDYDVAAYVWPAYQPEPRWAELGIFDAGKGEWQNVWEAVPKWEGHLQPLVPLWGYENEADPKVVEKKIEAAVSHGVNVFIYDWYWYEGRPFLEDALDRGFLGAPNNGKMKFFVMWANHHVNWLWDNKTADKRWENPRWRGWVDADEFRKISDRWISMYFSRPNYYRIGGKPVLMIYEVGTFVEGLGGAEKAAAALADFRARCEKAGLGGVHVMACDYGLAPEMVKALGIDSATIYNMVHWSSSAGNPEYSAWAEKGARRFDEAKGALGVPAYFAHASVGWDTNPRYPPSSVRPTVLGSTPEKFEAALRRAKDWCDRNTPDGMPKLITVNSWNEWTEGSYLEPDTHFKFGYLEAVKRVFAHPMKAKGAQHR